MFQASTERIAPRRIRMKKNGFLSFCHWTPSPQWQTRSASDPLVQSIEFAVAAERATWRHFACQVASPDGIEC